MLAASAVFTAGTVVAGSVATGMVMPNEAMAETASSKSLDTRLRSFDARYVMSGGESVTGFFTAPRSHDPLDIVVLMPGPASSRADLRATAQRQALGGALVFVPDLDATAGPLAKRSGHGAMMADVASQIEPLRRHPRSNGQLTIVAA